MSRDIEPTDRNDVERRSPALKDHTPLMDEDRKASRDREEVIGRTYAYRISATALEAMYDIGRFRTVAVEDVCKQRYQENPGQMREDLRSLLSQGLVQRRTVWLGMKKGTLAVLVLSKQGKKVLEDEGKPAAGQAVYAGFVKPAEVAHDAAIYRMYEAESREIEKTGGRVHRVVLDYELKRKVYSPLAKARGLPPLEFAKRKAKIAGQNGLTVIEGKIPLPDLRIEYATAGGAMAHVDLELATHHYHGAHLQAKAEAGFKMYAPDGAAGALRSVLEEREITAEILSL